FRQTGQHWGHARYPHDQWQGLQVFAVDGALLRTQDTTDLREHFDSGNISTQRQTPFPMLRLVALMNVRSHILVDAQISPYRRGEIPLASKFLSQIPDHSITLFDKGFWSADLSLSLSMQGQGRHWLIPEHKNLKSEVIETYAEGDVRVRMKVSPQARKNNPMLPEYWEVRQVSYAVGRSPSDTRFKPVCQYIAVQLIVMANANPLSGTSRRLSELRSGIGSLFLERRSRPTTPRTVKMSKTRYPVDRNAAPLK